MDEIKTELTKTTEISQFDLESYAKAIQMVSQHIIDASSLDSQRNEYKTIQSLIPEKFNTDSAGFKSKLQSYTFFDDNQTNADYNKPTAANDKLSPKLS